MDDLAMDSFRDLILQNSQRFGSVAAKVVNSMLGANLVLKKSDALASGPSFQNKVVVSIMFTGIVYGEYIFAVDESTAAKFLNLPPELDQASARAAIAEGFGEILNICVGECIVELGKTFKKLTITAPKTSFGNVQYSNIKTTRAVLSSPIGDIECLLCVDRMKLDIADSYKEAMSSLARANQELKEAMAKLVAQQSLLVQSEKMGALGKMAAGVAHEINTPLATIQMIGYELKDMVLEPTDVDRLKFSKLLDSVELTVSRISKVTNSLRAFASGLSNEVMSVKPIDDIVQDALLLSDGHLQSHNVQVRYLPLQDAAVECRAVEICQVLMNLIANACDAVETLNEKWIAIAVEESADQVEIRVTDSGARIPLEVQSKLFDPFFTTKQFGKGMGLGLSVAKGIVDFHGGSLQVDPHSATTSFILRLPKRQKRAA